MFTDSDILRRLANDGFLEEELFEIMSKLQQTLIGFDLIPYEKPMDTLDHIIIDYFD